MIATSVPLSLLMGKIWWKNPGKVVLINNFFLHGRKYFNRSSLRKTPTGRGFSSHDWAHRLESQQTDMTSTFKINEDISQRATDRSLKAVACFDEELWQEIEKSTYFDFLFRKCWFSLYEYYHDTCDPRKLYRPEKNLYLLGTKCYEQLF